MYVADVAVINSITVSLESLPKALADVDSIDNVDPGLREQFGLTAESLRAIQLQYHDGVISDEWKKRVGLLAENLKSTPLLDANEYQVKFTSPSRLVELRVPGGPTYLPSAEYRVYNVASPTLRADLELLALRAGFREPVLEVVVKRMMFQSKPTYAFDQAETGARQEAAAKAVSTKVVPYSKGFVIFQRGDVLKREQLELYNADITRWMETNEGWGPLGAARGGRGRGGRGRARAGRGTQSCSARRSSGTPSGCSRSPGSWRSWPGWRA